MAHTCVFCQQAMLDVEPCPFCGKQVCVDHGSIIHFKRGGTYEENLWACDDCLEQMPDGGEGHWFECKERLANDNGCALYQQLNAECDRIMDPIIAAWERGEPMFGMLKRAGDLSHNLGTSQVPNVTDSLVRPSRE